MFDEQEKPPDSLIGVDQNLMAEAFVDQKFKSLPNIGGREANIFAVLSNASSMLPIRSPVLYNYFHRSLYRFLILTGDRKLR